MAPVAMHDSRRKLRYRNLVVPQTTRMKNSIRPSNSGLNVYRADPAPLPDRLNRDQGTVGDFSLIWIAYGGRPTRRLGVLSE